MIVSGVVMAVAAVLLAVAPTWPVALVAAVLLGAGYGVYLSVDAALITQVLPRATDRAKDLGVINIANSAPQVLGPALAAPIVVAPRRLPDALRGDRRGDPARQRPGPQDPRGPLSTGPVAGRSRRHRAGRVAAAGRPAAAARPAPASGPLAKPGRARP